jgi:hypothetical protein
VSSLVAFLELGNEIIYVHLVLAEFIILLMLPLHHDEGEILFSQFVVLRKVKVQTD